MTGTLGHALQRAILGLLFALCAVLPAWAAGAEDIAKLEQQLAEQERTLGKEHLEVAKTLNSLVMLYHRQSRYAQAIPHAKRAL
ncbi:MAG: tetratricopeptide repeat protein, partial [Ottowia sp.]|nr:tetratricopeptide repeat protein [Ottowia sp.]